VGVIAVIVVRLHLQLWHCRVAVVLLAAAADAAVVVGIGEVAVVVSVHHG